VEVAPPPRQTDDLGRARARAKLPATEAVA